MELSALSFYASRPLKNPAMFTIPKKTMDFFEVTGGRVLSFRNVSVGEPAGPGVMQRSRFMVQKKGEQEPNGNLSATGS